MKILRDFVLMFILACCFQCSYCELRAVSVIGKSTAQSTTWPNHESELAVDGKVNTFSHTDYSRYDTHPWWRVDLGDVHCVGRINVTNRVDCCGYRFRYATVRAGNSSTLTGNQQCSLPATEEQSQNGAVIEFTCDQPVLAKYVTVDIDPSLASDDVFLHFAELTVEEHTTGECDADLAPKRTLGQFSLLYKGNQIANPDSLWSEVVKSPILCAWSCTKRRWCVFFDYSPRSGQCHLCSLVASAGPELTHNDDFAVYQLLE